MRLPGDGETREGNAALGAAMSGVGSVLAKTLAKLGTGISKTPAAQQLLDAGVRPSPGAASAGTIVPLAEQAMASAPGLARRIHGMQGRAVSDMEGLQWQPSRELSELGDRFEEITKQFTPPAIKTLADRVGGTPATLLAVALIQPGALIAALAARGMTSEIARRIVLGETGLQRGARELLQRPAQFVRPSAVSTASADTMRGPPPSAAPRDLPPMQMDTGSVNQMLGADPQIQAALSTNLNRLKDEMDDD